MQTDKKIETDSKVLRIKIDGKWTSSQFSNLFESLSFLYQLLSEMNKIEVLESQLYGKVPEGHISSSLLNINGELYKKLNFPLSYENSKDFENAFSLSFGFLNYSKYKRESFEDLYIKEIKYASPGFTDFVGAGKIIEQIFSIVKYYFPNKKEKLENEILEQELITKKIKTLELIGYSRKEIRKYLDTRNNVILNLKQLEIEKKIIDFEVQSLN